MSDNSEREAGRREVLDMLREPWRWHSATGAATMADAIERELGYEAVNGPLR